MSAQIPIRFITKQSRFAVANAPLNLSVTSTQRELNSILKALVNENCIEPIEDGLEFDFLIHGILLRISLEEFCAEHNLSYECEVEIEYFLKEKAPSPFNSLLHDDWVSSVSAKNDFVLSGCYDNTLHLWNLAKGGEHLIAIPAHGAPVKDCIWIDNKFVDGLEDDGKSLVFISSSHDETAIVWNWIPENNQVEYLFVFRGHCRSVDCLDVHTDLVATGSYDQMLKIWSLGKEQATEAAKQKKQKIEETEKNTKNRVPILTLSGHSEAISDCCWLIEPYSENKISSIATCSLDNTIRLWDIEVGENKQILKGSKAFLSLSFSPLNNLLISGSCDRHIRLWDYRSDEGSLVKSSFTSHRAWVSSVEWSTTNEYHFVSGSYDNNVKLWDIRSANAPLYDLIGHEDKILCISWSNPSYMISGGADNQLKIFSSDTYK